MDRHAWPEEIAVNQKSGAAGKSPLPIRWKNCRINSGPERVGACSTFVAADSSARISGNQAGELGAADFSNSRKALETFAGSGTQCTVSGVGWAQCSGGDVTRYS